MARQRHLNQYFLRQSDLGYGCITSLLHRQLIRPEEAQAFLGFCADVQTQGKPPLPRFWERDFYELRRKRMEGERRAVPLDPRRGVWVEFYGLRQAEAQLPR